jgi:hypothetical protein
MNAPSSKAMGGTVRRIQERGSSLAGKGSFKRPENDWARDGSGGAQDRPKPLAGGGQDPEQEADEEEGDAQSRAGGDGGPGFRRRSVPPGRTR